MVHIFGTGSLGDIAALNTDSAPTNASSGLSLAPASRSAFVARGAEVGGGSGEHRGVGCFVFGIHLHAGLGEDHFGLRVQVHGVGVVAERFGEAGSRNEPERCDVLHAEFGGVPKGFELVRCGLWQPRRGAGSPRRDC